MFSATFLNWHLILYGTKDYPYTHDVTTDSIRTTTTITTSGNAQNPAKVNIRQNKLKQNVAATKHANAEQSSYMKGSTNDYFVIALLSKNWQTSSATINVTFNLKFYFCLLNAILFFFFS